MWGGPDRGSIRQTWHLQDLGRLKESLLFARIIPLWSHPSRTPLTLACERRVSCEVSLEVSLLCAAEGRWIGEPLLSTGSRLRRGDSPLQVRSPASKSSSPE